MKGKAIFGYKVFLKSLSRPLNSFSVLKFSISLTHRLDETRGKGYRESEPSLPQHLQCGSV